MLAFALLTAPAGAEPESYDLSISRASAYLQLLDRGRYEEAWHEMSALFQALGDQASWQKRQQALRAAYGALQSRTFFHAISRESYKLSPDGRYVIVQFNSIYQHKQEARETVVMECSTSTACSIREYIIN